MQWAESIDRIMIIFGNKWKGVNATPRIQLGLGEDFRSPGDALMNLDCAGFKALLVEQAIVVAEEIGDQKCAQALQEAEHVAISLINPASRDRESLTTSLFDQLLDLAHMESATELVFTLNPAATRSVDGLLIQLIASQISGHCG
eukprot:SAG11_NODE_6718_length_1260_cov_6.960379_2_plen_145_part_00